MRFIARDTIEERQYENWQPTRIGATLFWVFPAVGCRATPSTVLKSDLHEMAASRQSPEVAIREFSAILNEWQVTVINPTPAPRSTAYGSCREPIEKRHCFPADIAVSAAVSRDGSSAVPRF
jgi:hypothetical protein